MNTEYLYYTTSLSSPAPEHPEKVESKFKFKYKQYETKSLNCDQESLALKPKNPIYSFIYNTDSQNLFFIQLLISGLYSTAKLRSYWYNKDYDNKYKLYKQEYDNYLHEYRNNYPKDIEERASKLLSVITSHIAGLHISKLEEATIRKFGYTASKIVFDSIVEGLLSEEDRDAVTQKLIKILSKSKVLNSILNNILKPTDLPKFDLSTLLKFKDPYELYTSSISSLSKLAAIVNSLLMVDHIVKYCKFSDIQKIAYESGATIKEAEQFKNWYQIHALKIKNINIKQALEFNCIKFEAFKAGITLEDALKFDNIYQIEALELGVTLQEAIQFNNVHQVNFLKANSTLDPNNVKYALQVHKQAQVRAFELGIEPKDAIKIGDYINADYVEYELPGLSSNDYYS